MISSNDLARIDSIGLSTADLLGQCLLHMNSGKRVTFLCESGTGRDVVQRVRMRLSRLRNSMDAKNLPKQHFRLRSNVFSYTNRRGKRMDCIVLEKIKTRDHEIFETMEGLFKNADPSANDASKKQSEGFEW